MVFMVSQNQKEKKGGGKVVLEKETNERFIGAKTNTLAEECSPSMMLTSPLFTCSQADRFHLLPVPVPTPLELVPGGGSTCPVHHAGIVLYFTAGTTLANMECQIIPAVINKMIMGS